jgi:hypothetical protein
VRDPPSARTLPDVWSRRRFLVSCSTLALVAAGCARLRPHTEFASLVFGDPHPDQYRPILASLIRTILPFEHPRFPAVTADALVERFFQLFPLEDEEKYQSVQRSFLFFNEIDFFPRALSPLLEEERKALDADRGEGRRQIAPMLDQKRREDEAMYDEFLASRKLAPCPFLSLAPPDRADYLRLWSRSRFVVKRQFVGSVRSLVLITAYSTEPFWRAIGYLGPLGLDRT